MTWLSILALAVVAVLAALSIICLTATLCAPNEWEEC